VPSQFDKSPQAALAWETNSIAKIAAAIAA
jgi:hypothetical protein